ncbi:cytochrome p450 76a2 [Phtheirospermum japonicum]|uniref:Cytochrome p450 76a2 n=1 Tax=Phtheirospermum japonicum TaxID=374723 RepID=A0A830CR36_9LAMI|nr:cytochrome p450 76a2 [Phtheirospermum japonicum]
MDCAIAAMVLTLLLYAAWAAATKRPRHRPEDLRPLPPGPKPWPVLGNIFQLGGNSSAPSLAKLADQYGAVMTLHLGSMTTVVISSSTAARAMFRHHDAVFAGRTVYEAMKGEIGNEGSLIIAQYGPHWRMLRRLCTAEFFAAAPLDAMRGVRAKCVDGMVQYIRDASSSGSGGVDVGRFFFLMAFNLIGNLIFSKDLLDPKSERGAKFFYHAGKATEFAGKPNVADFLPVLKRVDPQGIQRRTQFHLKQASDVVGEFLEERMRDMENGSGYEKRRKDYLDVLLEYKGDGVEGPFPSNIINVMVLVSITFILFYFSSLLFLFFFQIFIIFCANSEILGGKR